MRRPGKKRLNRSTAVWTIPRLKKRKIAITNDAVEDLPQLQEVGVLGQPLVQDREHARSDHGTEQRAEAAERDEHEDAHVHVCEGVRRPG